MTELNLRGNRVIADAFIGSVNATGTDVTLPLIESTSTTTSVGPGSLTEVIVELLNLIEAVTP